ncbi:MAG: D-aminoacyl-tRNA deacylase [Candidatus Izemoplasmatales bacterium]|nr:D-aminoacyl-tRNA deacylase [Candidatus Izemoplasmatales bacterium]NLF48217.1 D-tyrosyl-tRNA(Tyr) deacylase [Acholeplasmataceae bacterium]MDD4354759.1 D-aminoacyl-tRNA deacylase [Candidatus Izemoplasmatales bacterium]MDD4987683.1 D-aminoacyl-tRNA deacylase [Candidatus Izemoplasmatales bacterium]MDD5601655.1 D-aminoacyl-tRNA deacylase [Candidatus Izemoplasmatales bacterium]
MRVLVQRVKEASIAIANQMVASIGPGMLLLVGFTQGDDLEKVRYMAQKIAKLRVFSDSLGKMNLNLSSVNGELLVVSQFTLYANLEDGNRPSFTQALAPELARPLYDAFNQRLEVEIGQRVKTGVFGENMAVSLINDGPVTIWLER